MLGVEHVGLRVGRMLDRACRHPAGRRAPARFGANGSGMIDRPANWMIDDSSSSVAVQLLAKDASFAREPTSLSHPFSHVSGSVRVHTRTYARDDLCEGLVSPASLKQATLIFSVDVWSLFLGGSFVYLSSSLFLYSPLNNSFGVEFEN